MDFEMTEERKMIVQTARKIAETYGPEYWLQMEENHRFPKEFYGELGRVLLPHRKGNL